jgi:hypothetical protein
VKYFFLILLCIACGDDQLPKVDKLESFRILGAVATQPEVNPPASTTVSLVVSDVNGSTNVTGTFETCIDPGISRGAPVTCEFDPARVPPQAHTIDFASLSSRTGVNPNSVTVNVPATILTGRSARESNNGVAYIVIFRFIVNGKENIAFKRIIATTRTPVNSNPNIADFLINGVTTPAVTTTPPDKSDFLLTSSTPPEQYDIINVDGTPETKSETYEVAWYSNIGEFDRPKARLEEASELKLKSSGPIVFLGILRDERGGFDVVKVEAP